MKALLHLGIKVKNRLYRLVMDQPTKWESHCFASNSSLRDIVHLADYVIDLKTCRILKKRTDEGLGIISKSEDIFCLFQYCNIQSLESVWCDVFDLKNKNSILNRDTR